MPRPPQPRPRPSKRPRFRYVLFAVLPAERAPSRSELIEIFRTKTPASLQAWLTRYERGLGILRVARGSEREARRFLDALEAKTGVRLTTRSTSGTIAGLERRLEGGKLGRGERRRDG